MKYVSSDGVFEITNGVVIAIPGGNIRETPINKLVCQVVGRTGSILLRTIIIEKLNRMAKRVVVIIMRLSIVTSATV